MVTLHEIARAINGRVTGGQVLAPGPNHSRRDASLSVRLSDASPDGFIVFSHAGDDWRYCRDYVADALGLDQDRWRESRHRDPIEAMTRRAARYDEEERERQEIEARRQRARALWDAASDPRGTLVQTYLRGRGLDLSHEIACDVIRFHPACPWEGSTVPAMVAAMRDVRSGQLVAIHRTALTEDGQKIGRKMLAPTKGAAVMLDAHETITTGLGVGEGIESVMAARQLGIRPAWALGSIGAIAAFPVLPGVEHLTLLAENDANGASDRGCQEAGARWHSAGRTVDLIRPERGKDLNDELMGRTEA